MQGAVKWSPVRSRRVNCRPPTAAQPPLQAGSRHPLKGCATTCDPDARHPTAPLASKAPPACSIHPLPRHLHQIPPIPILQHGLGLALQLFRADSTGAEGHYLRAGHFQALALFQRGDELPGFHQAVVRAGVSTSVAAAVVSPSTSAQGRPPMATRLQPVFEVEPAPSRFRFQRPRHQPPHQMKARPARHVPA